MQMAKLELEQRLQKSVLECPFMSLAHIFSNEVIIY